MGDLAIVGVGKDVLTRRRVNFFLKFHVSVTDDFLKTNSPDAS